MAKRIEGKVKTFLFKEAHNRREHQKQQFINKFLFHEAEDRFASVLKEAMPRGAGQSTLKNSGWNTVWDWSFPSERVEQIRQEIEEEFSPYFYDILHGKHKPIKAGITISDDKKQSSDDVQDGSIYFRFSYRRAVAPLPSDDPTQQAAHDVSQNALNTLNEILPGFREFADAIEANNVPLQPYHYGGDFSTASGGLTEGRKEFLFDFIKQERQRHSQGLEGAQTSTFYRQHEAMLDETGDIPISTRQARKKIFSNSDIPNVATFNDLFRAIQFKVQDGYTLNMPELTRTVKGLIDESLQKHQLDVQSQDPKERGYIDTYKYFYFTLFKDITTWFEAFATKGTSPTNVDVTLQELRLALAHLTTPTANGRHSLEPDQFSLSTRTPYYSNGWDSSPNNARQKMLTLPPLRQLPDGEVRYDRGNGNMGYDHLTSNWKDGVELFLSNWGPKCHEWYEILSTGNANEALSTQSPETFDAFQNVFNNRTSAENVLDIIAKSQGNWDDFKQNHLDKSFYSEIRTVYNGMKVLEAEKHLDPSPVRHKFPIQANPDSDVLQQVNEYAQQMLSLSKSSIEYATEMFDALNKNLIALYSNQELDWDTLTLALKQLNDARKLTNIKINPQDTTKANNWVGQTQEDATYKMDAKGFEAFRNFGYSTAKMMDFLSAVMTRCCVEQVNTREDGNPETFYGHQYSGSSGKGRGGEIILSVRYAFSAPELSQDPKIIQQVRDEQRKRHVRARSRLQRQTKFPEHAEPTGRFADPNDPESEVGIFEPLPNEQTPIVTIVENVEYFLGQAAGKRRFAKTIRHGLPWRHMIDQFMLMYPDVGDQLGVIFEPMNADLQRLELSCKRAIDKVRQGIEVHYTNDDGETTVLSSDQLQSESLELGDIPEVETEAPKSPEIPVTSPGVAQPTAPAVQEIPVPEMEVVDQQPVQTQEENVPPNVVKSMPSVNFVGKNRNNNRQLLRSHSHVLGSVSERFIRSANKLDEIGETKIADKIDVLLSKIQEEKI